MDDPLDYQTMKRSLEILVDRYFPPEIVTPESHPAHVLDRMEKASMSMAHRGAAVALGDCVEITQDVAGAQLEQIDAELARGGGYPLSTLRTRLSRRRNKA